MKSSMIMIMVGTLLCVLAVAPFHVTAQEKAAKSLYHFGDTIRLRASQGGYLNRIDEKGSRGVRISDTADKNSDWKVISNGEFKVGLVSSKNDNLHVPGQNLKTPTTWGAGVGCQWTIEYIESNKVRLKSWKEGYLVITSDSPPGVTTTAKGETGGEASVWLLEK